MAAVSCLPGRMSKKLVEPGFRPFVTTRAAALDAQFREFLIVADDFPRLQFPYRVIPVLPSAVSRFLIRQNIEHLVMHGGIDREELPAREPIAAQRLMLILPDLRDIDPSCPLAPFLFQRRTDTEGPFSTGLPARNLR